MCRFVVYVSKKEPLLIADLVTRPHHSIIHQSFDCKERLNAGSLNGDGFGIGWYTKVDDTACVFTCVNPAWSNLNLRRLAEKIESHLIFAHVRAASPGLPVHEANCHPFQYGPFLWMHNGQVSCFKKIKRKLLVYLHEDLFNLLQGTTDSEHCFMLFLHILLYEKRKDCEGTRDLDELGDDIEHLPEDDQDEDTRVCDSEFDTESEFETDHEAAPCMRKRRRQKLRIKELHSQYTASQLKEAMEDTIALLTKWGRQAAASGAVKEPALLNFAVTDGHTVIVTRFTDEPKAQPASLYYASGTRYESYGDGDYHMTQARRQQCYIVASEPLSREGEDRKDWVPVPKNALVLVTPESNLLMHSLDHILNPQ